MTNRFFTWARRRSIKLTAGPCHEKKGKVARDLSRNVALRVLLVIVLLGGLLRLTALERPGVWGDEAATYGRVKGSYFELINVLQTDGFAPLHYQLYWVLGRGLNLDPEELRFVPTVTGMGMILAMYHLARRFMSRKTALWVAAFTACSAYMLGYSRDAKMYMPFWLMCTLSTSVLIRYVQTRRRVLAGVWILCAIGMVGLHSLGLVMLAVQGLVVLVCPRVGFRPIALYVLALPVILAGPGVHHLYFSKWDDDISKFGWGASGISWVNLYNRDRDGAEMLRYTLTAYLMSWEWPDRKDYRQQVMEGTAGFLRAVMGGGEEESRVVERRKEKEQSSDRENGGEGGGSWVDKLDVYTAYTYASCAVGVMAVLGMFAWRRVKEEEMKPGGVGHVAGVLPRWAGILIVGFWFCVPVYGFYCFSMKAPAAPWEIQWHVMHVVNMWSGAGTIDTAGVMPSVMLLGAGVCVAIGAVLLSERTMWQTVRSGLMLLAVSGGVFAAMCVVYVMWLGYSGYELKLSWENTPEVGQAVLPGVAVVPRKTYEPQSLWMPRYLGLVWPAFAMGLVCLIMRLPTVWVRSCAMGVVLVINLGNFLGRVVIDPEPPVGTAVADVFEGLRSGGNGGGAVLTFAQPGGGMGFGPGEGWLMGPSARYYASLKLIEPMRPPEFRDFRPTPRLPAIRQNVRANVIAKEAADDKVRKVILWERSDRGFEAGEEEETIRKALGERWTPVSSKVYYSYDHWNWRKLPEFRRTVYVKRGIAAERDATTKPDGNDGR